MPPLDDSDPLNSAILQVIETLQGFARADLDWEMEDEDFVKGFPSVDVDTDLERPKIAVYDYGGDVYPIAYDDLLATNNLPVSDINYEELHGVAQEVYLYIDIYTERGTEDSPVMTGGGTLARRLAGKIATRMQLHHHCLGEDWTVEAVKNLGMIQPKDSNKIPYITYRIDLWLSTIIFSLASP